MNPQPGKQGYNSNEYSNLKPLPNEQLAANNQNNRIVFNQQTQMSPVIFNQSPINPINEEIKAKIMSSNFCYIKQDLESFFAACLGCCSDFFKYKVYVSNQQITEIDKIDGAILRVKENEDCCMRTNFCCMKLCKPVSLYLHPLKDDSFFGHYSFPCCTCCNCSCECCYCLGPPYTGYFSKENELRFGSMRQRSHWCTCVDCCFETHRLFDVADNSRFIIEKICCQLGGCLCSTCSGYYPLKFNILHEGNVVGTITRSAKACCCGTKLYYFEILFPTIATFEERMLLIGFTLREHYLHFSQIIYTIDYL